ncbi:DUF5009 domain-containing protein [Mucilaginibacter ginkgonis]|uniref:DUF5009 domain-containing protein n=1 Tax=Mucilaginibacter ginkgonis TaxID=2682091 RepID=A0A6I4I034_9SPHI|nr:DUF5009 domain-containing protein [Mucilaginibacter ginkgonis]QQL48872.1 DUF5009 domain-containing protein [Mucilaginibacter ginkgonis]
MSNFSDRVRSIDAFRALTMFLMIFVNDLDGIPHTPAWLKHVGEQTDGLGLADTIFPVFLFIVGLSIPFAFNKREKKGQNVLARILIRSFALLLIGFYHSNMETYNEQLALLPKPVWQSLLTISFFFLFADYRNTIPWKRWLYQGIGLVLLIVMSILFKSTDAGHPWLHYSWWGILGLIGWSYLICSLIYYYSGGVLWVQAAAWIFFLFFNLDYHFGMISFMDKFYSYIWLAGSGAMQAFTMAGIVVSVMYMRLKSNNDIKLLWVAMVCLAAILFNLGFIVRYYSGGISKMHDTPSWVFICTGIALVAYAFFAWLVDFAKQYNWVKVIEPAGKETFTCYLVPFIFYPLYQFSNLGYPEYLSEGTGGLIKALVFSFAMIWIAGLLNKIGIKLKI